jgi:arylsulfatase A-like enzyme
MNLLVVSVLPAFLLALPWDVCTADAVRAKPNILFLLTDDQRWDTLGCMGNPVIQTPNIDHLAAQGTLFRNAFVTASVCSVSRAAILAGAYPCSRGTKDLAKMVTPKEVSAIYPAVLRAGGYDTGYIGKWDVGVGEDGFHMGMNLFDYWAGDRFHGNYWHEADCQLVTNDGRQSKSEIKCTCPPDGSMPRTGSAGMNHPIHFDRDIVPIKMRQFLAGRDKAKPFFLAIAFRGPKDPWSDCPKDVAGLYASIAMPIPATATMADAMRQPAFLRASMGGDTGFSQVSNPATLADELRKNYRLVSTIDTTVGELRRILVEQGLDSNTIIVFTSDNGHFHGDHGFWGKWLPYEESIRVPLVVFDPRVPADRRGLTRTEMVLNVDLAPTILAWSGFPVPATMQGRNFAPLVGGGSLPWREDFYHEFTWTAEGRIEPSEGIRSARWKYIRYPSQKPVVEQLFDLQKDPGETTDLIADPAHSTMLDSLRAKLEAYRLGLSAAN